MNKKNELNSLNLNCNNFFLILIESTAFLEAKKQKLYKIQKNIFSHYGNF